ncbi:MAG: flagellar hook-associated protein 1 FlgK [Gammaproteobacteria bacterium]|jgi:flagellar hook-associated protein 1 FlgK
MPSILNTSLSGLLTFQRSMATTSHNISNVNTPGYSRQNNVLSAQHGQGYTYGFVGNGVKTETIERIRDNFIESRLRGAITDDGRTRMYAELAGQIDSLLAGEQTGLGPAVSDFFATIQNLANDPSSTTSRQLMLSQASVLVDRFHFMDGELASVSSQMNSRLNSLVTNVNALADDIASINNDIVTADSAGDEPPNDLLDLREQRINQLSALVGVTTLTQENGAVNVFSSSGQALVINITAQAWQTSTDPADPSQLQVADATGAVISDKLSGGELGGLFDFRREALGTARNELGRIATVMADALNAQHRLGLDANGNLGQDLFVLAAPQTNPHRANTGTASASAVITDTTQLSTSDYRVDYDGATFTMTRLSDGVNVSGPGPLVLDGLQVSMSAGVLAGDRFLVKPVLNGAASIGLAFSDLDLIATAGPVRASSGAANTSDAPVAQPAVLDATDPALSNTVSIVFNTPATTFDVFDVTAGTTLVAGVVYTADAAISFNGWTTHITGVPVAGDSFRIEANVGGSGDNRNALALGALQTNPSVGGSMSFQQAYSTFVGRAGVTARSAQLNADARDQLLADATNARETVSGVNLDEEAIALTRHQQAYQAMARMVETSNSLFDTILAAVR